MTQPMERKEWSQLVSGELTPQIHCLALQFALSRVRTAYRFNRITMEDAVKEIYEVCKKYESQVTKDLDSIFR